MRQPYPSDMTDAQWELLEDLFPEALRFTGVIAGAVLSSSFALLEGVD